MVRILMKDRGLTYFLWDTQYKWVSYKNNYASLKCNFIYYNNWRICIKWDFWKGCTHLQSDAIVRCKSKLCNIFQHPSSMCHHGIYRRRYVHPSKSSWKWSYIKCYGCECPIDMYTKYGRIHAMNCNDLMICTKWIS